MLSSVIAKRWKNSSGGAPCWTGGQSSETPASVSQSRPRSAICFVTRAKASRPVSVNSIVTSGCWVFGSKFCSGFLISLPESSESSSITKKRCTRSDWFGAGSPSTTTIPWGTLKTREPSGGPAGPSASSSFRHSVPFAYLFGVPPSRS